MKSVYKPKSEANFAEFAPNRCLLFDRKSQALELYSDISRFLGDVNIFAPQPLQCGLKLLFTSDFYLSSETRFRSILAHRSVNCSYRSILINLATADTA